MSGLSAVMMQSALLGEWLHRFATCSVVALLCGLGSAPIYADSPDAAALLAQKRCNACHDMSSALIGPPLIAIASRYAPNKDEMVEVLAHKIVLGGGGSWGSVPMVPNDDRVTLEQARTLARWILDLHPPT